jgi:uncharacterized protein (TIGR02996 family)
MSDDERAILRAVCRTPDDDLPRLVYADWLADNARSYPCPACGPRSIGFWMAGDVCARCCGTRTVPDNRPARAEFIRGHVTKGSDFVYPFTPDLLGVNLYNLFKGTVAHMTTAAGWVVRAGFGPAGYSATMDVARGFIGVISLPLAGFVDTAPALFAAHPITTVTLTDREPFRFASGEWQWHVSDARSDIIRHPAALPADLFRLIDGHDTGAGFWKGFRTRPFAVDALSAACVRFGRRAAGIDQ